jgi:voltage-gated potassium channel
MTKKYSTEEFKRANYEVFIWLLTLLSIFNVLLVFLLRDENVTAVIMRINWLLSLIFLGDFLFRLYTAESRQTYFLRHFGWLDLLSSLPVVGMQVARLVRLIRTTRLLDASGEKKIVRQVISNRANTAVLFISLFVIFLLQFGSIAILDAEAEALTANIKTVNEAIWWVLVTISTVGYGDYYPVTTNGRIVGIFVITAGVAVFGTLSAFLAKFFLGHAEAADEDHQTLQTILANMQHLQQEQAELKQVVQAEREALRMQLAAMEQLLKQTRAEQNNK